MNALPVGRLPAPSSQDELEQRYLGLMQISGEAVLIVCAGLIVFANQPACELFGLTAACELRGLPFLDFIARGHQASVRARLKALKKPGQTSAFVRRDLLRADRKPANVEVAMHACAFQGLPAVQVLMRDLGEQRRLQAEVVRLAQFDALTDLSNRTHFLDRLDAAIERAQREGTTLGVASVGLDNFRAVNDAAGQHGGDIVLVQVAERLRSTSHAGDTLARLGGDEFGLVLEGMADSEAAAIAARRLMESLTGGFSFDGAEYFATFSIGIALFPRHARRRDRLLCKAMLAMKFAKAHGGNRFQLYSDQLDQLDRGDTERRARTVLRMQTLTRREREVLDLLVTGKASKMIGYLLGVSARTIEIHRGRVMEKMEADSVAELVHMTLELQA
jgi:diguanylate cyclase (GGDEF)-like protein/PAS domain S-box-containing protein